MLGTASATVLRARRVRTQWQFLVLPGLLASIVLLTVLSCAYDPTWVPPSLLVLPLLAAGLFAVRRRDVVVVVLAAYASALTVLGVRGATAVPPPVFLL